LPGLRRRPKSILRKKNKKPNWSGLVPDIKKTAKEQAEQEESQKPIRK
jgi:hypothetical protein